jgi:monovalent cation:H+ antiporter, CPA1 family
VNNVGAFVALLAAGVALSVVCRRWKIPAAVVLVATGAVGRALFHTRLPFDFVPALFFVFLPPLVFEGAWSVDAGALRERVLQVFALAVPGTLFCAAAVAYGLSGLGILAFAPAFVLGAIVAATDPVAVIAAFRGAAVPVGVRTLVEAESLCNDGVALALYGSAVVLATGQSVNWLAQGWHGALQVVGGGALGVVCAVPVWFALRASTASSFEVVATLVLAYGAYLLADRFHLSGIFATASAAVALRALLRRGAHLSNRDDVDAFWSAGAFAANAIVFLATGLSIDVSRIAHEPALVAGVIVLLALSRAILAFAFVREGAQRIVVFMAGMRGALPLALALALPAALPARPEIIDAVLATVLITLVFQGLPLGGIVRRLYGTAEEGPVTATARSRTPAP